ncbi:MAG: (d)CMP kinase [Clostridia bacterium]|nr:(d)CMP kinase [Clostridia bacterium]
MTAFVRAKNTILEIAKTSDKQLIIAIDGNCGSGKSTLASKLANALDANLFHMDDFYLPEIMKTEERMAEPGGNVDYERFKNEVMVPLLAGSSFMYRKFSCQVQGLGESVFVTPKRINIVEGAYALHPDLIYAYDLKVFMSHDYKTQCDRIMKRNGPEKLKTFIEKWIPLENRYFEALGIKEKCDLVIDTGTDWGQGAGNAGRAGKD